MASCNNEDVDTSTASGPYIPTTTPVLQQPDTHTVTLKTDSVAKKVRRAVKPKDITVKQALKDMRFNPQAVKLFVSLADKTGGQSYFAKNSKMVANTIVSILDKHTTQKTDVVLLIDKTGSMYDDIENVKSSATKIISQLKKFDNIQLGWGAYGDKNDTPDSWFELHNLSADLDNSLDKIQNLTTGGGEICPNLLTMLYIRLLKT
ncbi:MAG: VWA domain-containing protein [Sphingobacteriales bacterium JAD_PAG50586_3]|nr:MAG: VWA domain-containing protein [Sphingobacteriales bacterium JAD_PAG50586_3]